MRYNTIYDKFGSGLLFFWGGGPCILSKYVLRALDVPVSWTVLGWYGRWINQQLQ